MIRHPTEWYLFKLIVAVSIKKKLQFWRVLLCVLRLLGFAKQIKKPRVRNHFDKTASKGKDYMLIINIPAVRNLKTARVLPLARVY